MSELTQADANLLFGMDKHRADDNLYKFPVLGGVLIVPLVSADGRENFILDIHRGRINLSKVTYQNRARNIYALVRLDIGGSSHQNPDGEEVPSPHIHIYREGFGDKWAQPLPQGRFTNLTDFGGVLDEFMDYCNITVRPFIERGLFT